MHPLGLARAVLRAALAVWAGSALWLAAAEPSAPLQLPFPAATEWQVLVFGARFPAASARVGVPFTVKVSWRVGNSPGAQELAGTASWLKTTRVALSLPAGCDALEVLLDWQAPGVDLDLGLECAEPRLRLAPVFTVLQPERVRLDAQTVPFYQWLSARHPEWWKGYPFWAEVEPAPRPSPSEAP